MVYGRKNIQEPSFATNFSVAGALAIFTSLTRQYLSYNLSIHTLDGLTSLVGSYLMLPVSLYACWEQKLIITL